MPALIRRFSAHGLSAVNYDAESLADAARHEPSAGVYTVSNTFRRTKTLLLDAHLDRLEESAKRENMPLRLDRAGLRSALRRMIIESDFGAARFRISVPAVDPTTALLSIEPYQPPAATLLEQGARCATARLTRRNPEAKSSDWMQLRRALQSDASGDPYEIILVDGAGRLLEGAGSNFYAIIDGTLRTAGDGILPGISRRIVLETSGDVLPLRMDAPRLSDLAAMSEAFISSSSRGIVPVVAIDARDIGAGRVGDLTKRLRSAYQAWVSDHLEEL